MELYISKRKYWIFLIIHCAVLIGIPFMVYNFFYDDKNKTPEFVLVILLISFSFGYIRAISIVFQLLKLNKERPIIYVENDYLYDYSPSFFRINGLDLNNIISVNNGRTHKNLTTYKLTLNEQALNRNIFERIFNMKPKINDQLVDSEELNDFMLQLREKLTSSRIDLL